MDNGARRRGPGPRFAEKPKNFRGTLGKLLRYLGRYRFLLLVALLLAAGNNILTLVGPGCLAEMTRLMTEGLKSGGIDVAAVTRVATTLAGLYGISFLFGVLQGELMATVTQGTSRSLRRDISQKINRLPLSYFDGTTVGDILSRVTNDVDTIGQTLNQSLGQLVSAVTMFLGSLLLMFLTNWIMALAGVLATALGFILMTLIISRSQKYFIAQQRGLGALNGHIEETYAGHIIIKAYNGEEQANRTFDELNGNLYGSAWRSQFFAGLMPPLMGFIGNLGYVVVCVTGAILTMKGLAGFEVIIAFMLYIRFFSQPLQQFSQAATSLQSATAAAERVFEFLGEKEMEDESGKETVLTAARGDVDFEHVRFGYRPEKTIIHDFSAHAKAGQKIAIVGPTGAGKTTMVNLLMRFYDVESGEIRIDGVPIAELTRTNIHGLFGMVLQDTWLFEGTIRENIVYSKEGVSDEEVIRACQAVGLHRFIMTLPKGYDTVLNDNASLSAGQKQLVTIARAMIEDAPMLILDEATSSVDTRTEKLIQQAMDRLMKGRTSFVIAHRLSTIKNADLILVMKDGDIIESGSHAQLMASGGFYADLYNSQFEQAA
ncbi:MAG: ABC transporter ATP-binding protein/permease [Clostridia bacterium]|nr:ABC transporter ATP-binding protein/permease [Clostridia bacterium]